MFVSAPLPARYIFSLVICRLSYGEIYRIFLRLDNINNDNNNIDCSGNVLNNTSNDNNNHNVNIVVENSLAAFVLEDRYFLLLRINYWYVLRTCYHKLLLGASAAVIVSECCVCTNLQRTCVHYNFTTS